MRVVRVAHKFVCSDTLFVGAIIQRIMRLA
jgi:hypothetical protein